MKTIKEYSAEDVLKHVHGNVVETIFWNIQGQINNAKNFLETEKDLEEDFKLSTEKTIEEQEKVAKAIFDYHGSYFVQSKEMLELKKYYDNKVFKKELTMLEKLQKHLEENPYSFEDWIENKNKLESQHLNRVYNRIKDLSNEELDKLFSSFLKWEEEYEEYEYTVNFCQTFSNILDAVMEVFKTYGKPLEFDEDFFSEAYEYRGYVVKVFCGQGCFYRFFKGEEMIFQTT